MTRDDHASGTDRVAEVASLRECRIRGEHPGRRTADRPRSHRRRRSAAAGRARDPDGHPARSASKIRAKLSDPNVVKVVTDRFENAIYFSRATIPFRRDRRRPVHVQAHRAVCVPARFPVALFRDCPSAARDGRAAGTTARARKRISHPRSRDRIRIAGSGYARRSGTRASTYLNGNNRF